MGKYFGTDGFRGEAGVVLTAEHGYRVGRFLGYHFGRGAKILIGKDTRRSSYMLEYALAAGITASGSDAYLLHVTTTPSVAYVAQTEEFSCGVMISASHNPFYDNGIKLLNGQGEKMDDATVDQLEAYLDGKMEIPYATGGEIGRTVDYVAGRNRYIGYLVSLGIYSLKGLRVGLDCANGATWAIAKSVFEALGAETFLLGAEPNGTNINLDLGSTHPEKLQQFVLENQLDVGFAYDGDGDRCICVDETGQLVTGDHILYILAGELKRQRQLEGNRVVATVMSNLGLFKALDAMGIDCEKTQVGDRFVYARMQELRVSLGGEQSGHIIISKYATTGDGILTSLKLMEVMLERKLPMSKLAGGLTVYPQVLVNVPGSAADLEKPKVQAALQEAEEKLRDRGRLLVRPSGTEPVIRVMAEADTEALCRLCVDLVANALRKER